VAQFELEGAGASLAFMKKGMLHSDAAQSYQAALEACPSSATAAQLDALVEESLKTTVRI